MTLVNVIKVVAYVCVSVVSLALSPPGKKGFCLKSAVGMRIWIKSDSMEM